MPALSFALAEIPLQLVSSAPVLIELLADYFRYYQPLTIESQLSNSAIQLTLNLCDTLPARESLLPADAQLFSHTGVIKVWHARQASQFYFDAGVAVFDLDTTAGRGTGFVSPAAMEHPRILANTYVLFSLMLLLRARGLYHLHAAAARSPQGKLCLFPGMSRGGKTTLTTALGLAGWQPMADDSLLLDNEGRLWPLRKEFHLDAQLLARWPQLAGAERQRYLNRVCISALEFFDTAALAAQPFTQVAAIVLPQISEVAQSNAEPMPASAMLLKLAEQSVYLQLWREHTARQFERLSQLVQRAVTLRFFSGRDVLETPAQAAAILATALR